MFGFLLLCCIIGFVHGQTGPNSTTSDVTINGTIVVISEQVTNSDTTVGEAELATASTDSAAVFELTPTSSEDPISNETRCPRNSSKPCVVKCCPLGESIIGSGKVCEPTALKFHVNFVDRNETSNSDADEEEYNYIFGDPCPYGKYRLEPHKDSNDEFHILSNGTLRAPFFHDYLLQPHQYCLEVFRDADREKEDVLPLVCFTEPFEKGSVRLQYILYPIGLLISVPFLIVTVLVYCLIPELRDLHGKSLSWHVMCLTVAYIFLAAVQLGGETFQQGLCVTVAFVIQFSFVACFFWLNVLCFDTWWNVLANVKLQQCCNDSSRNQYMWYTLLKNGKVHMPKATERKVFIFYSLYAWCLPTILVFFSMTMDFMPTIPSSYLKPNFGSNKCWFSSEEAELPYFYGSVAFLICVNIILFICTAYMVFSFEWKAQRRKPRQMFRMCLSLFGVMGINWVMEVVSWAVGGPDYIWYITDIINTLQGVFIFCIFVLEPRVKECVWKRWGPKLSQILGHRGNTSSHVNVPYSTPEEAVVRTDM